MKNPIDIKVDLQTNVQDLDRYVTEHALTTDDIIFLGKVGKHLVFRMFDSQRAMMFKLRFGG